MDDGGLGRVRGHERAHAQPSGAGRDGTHIRNWRLQHVLLVSLGQLARETSVEEAALTAGYQNTSAFISAFRQVFGMTPGEYRRTFQGA